MIYEVKQWLIRKVYDEKGHAKGIAILTDAGIIYLEIPDAIRFTNDLARTIGDGR